MKTTCCFSFRVPICLDRIFRWDSNPPKEEKNSEPAQKTEEPASKSETQSEEPVVAPATPQPEKPAVSDKESEKEEESSSPPSSDDDPSVVRSEINDIRKSVVSLSVGQPDRTTTSVKEWLEQPEPAPPVEPEVEASDDGGEEAAEEK